MQFNWTLFVTELIIWYQSLDTGWEYTCVGGFKWVLYKFVYNAYCDISCGHYGYIFWLSSSLRTLSIPKVLRMDGPSNEI